MSGDDTFYDVFLCYKWEDGEAAEALRVALVSRRLRVFRDVIEGEVWAPLAESIKNALARSRSLVALITPRFPVSPHCREELHVALCAAYYLDDGDTSRVMAVTQGVSPDEVRPRQLTRFRLPRHGTPPPELAADIASVVARHTGVFGDAPTPSEPTWYPHERPGDRFFRGRYGELWELHEGLLARTKNRDRGHPVVSVRGLGGVGKTALVLAYARLFERDHPGGVFVLQLGGSDGRADTTDELVRTRYREQLGLIATRLNVAGPDDVAAELDRRGADYLWIVDDVPATTSGEFMPALYAPTRLGKTLMTTRGRFARFASLEHDLGELGLETGAQVLTAYRTPGRADRRSVLDIVRLLGQHPLGLTLAAGLTTLPSFTGYPPLQAQLSSTEPDYLEVAAHLEHELPAGCARPFANALVRGFGSLTGPVKEVLCAASVLAPTVVPHDLLAGMAHRARGINARQVAEGFTSPLSADWSS